MEAARDYVQTKLEPRALKGNHEEHFDIEIAREMGELGLLGATLPEEFGGAADYIAYGCVQRELDRVDSGYGTFFGAQSTLVMYPIFEFGTDETVLPWHAKSQCRRNRRKKIILDCLTRLLLFLLLGPAREIRFDFISPRCV